MTYRWSNPEHTAITGPNGEFIPVQVGNRHYDELIASGATIEEYVAPPIKPGAVKVEAELRKMAQQ